MLVQGKKSLKGQLLLESSPWKIRCQAGEAVEPCAGTSGPAPARHPTPWDLTPGVHLPTP